MRRLAGLAVALALADARPANAVELPTDFVDEPVGAGGDRRETRRVVVARSE